MKKFQMAIITALMASAGYLADGHDIFSDMRDNRDKYYITVTDVNREKDL